MSLFLLLPAHYASVLVVFVAGLNLVLGNAIIWLPIIFTGKNLVYKIKKKLAFQYFEVAFKT